MTVQSLRNSNPLTTNNTAASSRQRIAEQVEPKKNGHHDKPVKLPVMPWEKNEQKKQEPK